MSFNDLYKSVLDDNTLASEIVKIQKVFLDTTSFHSKDDILAFVNSNKLLKIISINGEEELFTSHENNPNIYFANKNNKMFKIGDNVLKVLEDGKVYTNCKNYNKLKNIQVQSINQISDKDIKVFDSYNSNSFENKTMNYYFNHTEDVLGCGLGRRYIYKTGISTSGTQNRTRLYLITRLHTDPEFDVNSQYGTVTLPEDSYFYVECEIRNAVRTWGIWIPASRTTNANINLTISIRKDSNNWEDYVYTRTISGTGHLIEREIDKWDISGIAFNRFIKSYNVSFKTPSIPQTTASCN